MATVLRVKRMNSDQPQDALIFCKRPRLNDDSDGEAACLDSVPTYAKFAGTLKDPEENVLQHLAKTLSKEEIEANFKKAPYVNLLERRRKQAKENSAANRFKVINYHRSLDTSNVEEFEDKVMTFIDIEDSVSLTINQNTTEEEQSSTYVYDLYYVAHHNKIDDDDDIVIRPYNEYEMMYEMSLEDGSNSEHDSEDSNAESYYQNSYPNTECSDEGSFSENDMKAASEAFNDCTINSEEEYEDYSDEPYPLNVNDVALYNYTKYKQRILSAHEHMNKDASDDQDTSSSNSSDSDEEIYPWNSDGHLVYNISDNACDA